MINYDLTIIGAGIIGAMAAYFSNQKNVACKILLIDKQLIGHGATAFSVGLDYPYAHSVKKRTLTQESVVLWNEIEPIIKESKTQMPLYGISSKKNLDHIFSNYIGNFSTVEDFLDDFKEIHKPVIKTGQTILKGENCTHYDAISVLKQLTNSLKSRKNCSIWEGLSVESILPSKECFQLLLSDSSSITTKKILLALGPWVVNSSLLELFQPLALKTKKIITLHIEAETLVQQSTIFLFDEDAFLLPIIGSNRYLFSFTRFSWDCLPDSSTLILTQADKEAGLTILRTYFPDLAHKCHGGRVFCDAYSENWTPVIEESHMHGGMVIASGGSGSGFRLAPSIAMRSLNLLGI